MSELPNWATEQDDGTVIVDADVAYPLYLAEMALEPTAHNVAAAKLCITRDLAEGYGADFVRFKADKATWSDAALGGTSADHEAGMQAGGKMREAILRKRAMRAGLPQ